VIGLLRLLEKGEFSLNTGGNERLGAITLGYDTKIPIVIHSGLTKNWETFFKKEWPGIFIGFEIRF